MRTENEDLYVAWDRVMREVAQQMLEETKDGKCAMLRLSLFLPVPPDLRLWSEENREAYDRTCFAMALNNLKHESTPYDDSAQTVIDKVPEYF